MHERVTSTSGCARRRDGRIWGRRISPLIRWVPGSSPLANTSRLSVATKRQLTMHELQAPFEGKPFAGTLAARIAAGKEIRNQVPRSIHAEWTPATDRPDPLSLLQEQNRSRLAHLVPLRYQRMAASPFTFLRGSAIVMAQEMATTPFTGIQVQAGSGAHLNNVGIY